MIVIGSYTYYKPTNSFVLDGAFITDFMLDSILHTIVLLVVGFIIAQIMMKKRYFDYPSHGLVVSKAYRNIMIAVVVTSAAIPYSFIFT